MEKPHHYYIIQFSPNPGLWLYESNAVYATREAALDELNRCHQRYSSPEDLALDYRSARRFRGVGPGYAMRIKKVDSRLIEPRRPGITYIKAAQPVLVKRC